MNTRRLPFLAALSILPAVACGGTNPAVSSSSAADTQSCDRASECSGPLPRICETCADGKTECAHWACEEGVCETATCDRHGGVATVDAGAGVDANTNTDSGSAAWQTSTTPTGLGNAFVTAYTGGTGCDDDGTSWSCSYTIQYLSYVDTIGYMRNSSGNEPTSISAWVSDVDGSAQTITLYLGARGLGDCTEPEPNLCNTFTTTTSFTTFMNGIEGAVTNVYAAFVGPQGQWDSNGGQNYTLGLPTTPNPGG
jgi:hypothetical protein